jgi:predicted SnoaL-like aldol condensation-catalyzing enzyme
MKFSPKYIAGFAAVALGCSLVAAQDIKLTPLEQKNQDVAFKEFHDMNQYYHYDLAPQVIVPDYIQHNPNTPGGLDGYVKYMTHLHPVPDPVILPEWKSKPILIITSGDLSLFMFDRQVPDPAHPDRKYNYNHVDMVRVENGMVQEHWDGVRKAQPPAAAPPKAQ